MKKLLTILFLLPIFVSAWNPFSNVFGLGDSTINRLDQWAATTTPSDSITQRIFGKTLRFTGLSSGCLQVDSNGILSATGSNCGSGGGGDFPFTVNTGYNSTSTVIGFNGLFSTASSTFSSNIYFPALSQGFAYIGSSGKLNTTASSSINLSWFNNDAGFLTSSGASAFEVATTSDIAVSQVGYFTKTSGRTTLGSVATGTITVPTGLTSTASRYVLGGNLTIGLDTGYVIPLQSTLDAKLSSYDAWTHPASGKSATTSAIGIGSSTPWGMLSVTQTGTDPAFIVEDSASPDTSPFIITATGNVGIGTTGPTGKLQVEGGQVAFGGAPAGSLWLMTLRGDYSWTAIDGSGNATFELYSNDKVMRLLSNTRLEGYNQDLTLGTNSVNNAVTIKQTTGNVGIGTTGPGAKLEVISSGDNTAVVKVKNNSNVGIANIEQGDNNSGILTLFTFGGAQNVKLSSNGTSYLSGGNVGIGTTSPNFKLVSTNSTGPQLSLSSGAGLAQWTMRNAGGNLYLSTTTVAGTATTSISAFEISGSGFGTTTLRGLNISGQATSTSNVGFNITSGCYAISGTCVGGGTITSVGDVTSGAAFDGTQGTTLTFNNAGGDGVLDYDGTRFNIDHSLRVGGKTSYGEDSITSTAGFTFESSGSATFQSNTVGTPYFSLDDDNTTFGFVSASHSLSSFTLTKTGLGIATTTPTHQFTIASSTAPQLSLSSGAGVSQWTMRNAGGNLYIATTSVAGTATSTTAAIRVDTNGAVYLNNLRTSTAGNALCYLAGNELVVSGGTTCATSALKGKTDIEDITKEQALGILDMEPVEYTLKENGQRRYGFIADWIKDEKLVEYTPDGEINGFDYLRYTALLTKLVQEQQKQIDNIVVGVVDTAQEKWQWGAIIVLFGLIAYQQIQIRKMKSYHKTIN